jgi:hypothetical protein
MAKLVAAARKRPAGERCEIPLETRYIGRERARPPQQSAWRRLVEWCTAAESDGLGVRPVEECAAGRPAGPARAAA